MPFVSALTDQEAMPVRVRPRSASLKALPPDSPRSVGSDSVLLLGGASQWTVNPKDRLPVQPKRALKSVSLRLQKGEGSPTAASRSSSSGQGPSWPSGFGTDLSVDGRPPLRQASSSGQSYPAAPKGKLSATAPATVGRPPPAPTRAVPRSEEAALHRQSPREQRRRGRREEPEAEETWEPCGSERSESCEQSRELKLEEEEPARPGTAVSDPAGGTIFRPLVEAPLTPIPFSRLQTPVTRPPPPSRPAPKSSPIVSKGLKLSQVISLPKKRPSSAASTVPQVAEEPLDPSEPSMPRPKIAWPDRQVAVEAGEDGSEDEGTSDVLELAAQIRRDMLANQLQADADPEDPLSLMGDAGEPSTAETKWTLRTEEARRSLQDMEKELQEANERAARQRAELGRYLQELKSKTFEAPDASPLVGDFEDQKRELLVALPADFDDVVDLNAQLMGSQRRSSGHRRRAAAPPPAASEGAGGASSSSGGRSSSGTGAKEWKMPAFLEKYFLEEKATELPYVRMQQEEAKKKGVVVGDTDAELEKAARQIQKLDELLAKREATGAERVRSSRIQLDAAKQKFSVEHDKAVEEKLELLRKLKEQGLVSSSAPSRASTKLDPGSSRAPPSRTVSVLSSSELVPFVSSEELGFGFADWSSWTSTAAEAPDDLWPPQPSTASGRPLSGSSAAASAMGGADDIEEPDTSTFDLTSMTSKFGGLRQPQKAAPEHSVKASKVTSRALATLARVAEGGEGLAEDADPLAEDARQNGGSVDVAPDDAPFFGADPADLEALKRIDEQLQKLVPEQEWEEKSIGSIPALCDVRSAQGGALSRSVWSRSSASTAVLPGEPVLRERVEMRDSAAALSSINRRLAELEIEQVQTPASPQLDAEALRSLLLQAAQGTAVQDVEGKVLSLTGKAEPLKQALTLGFAEPRGRFFQEAKQFLARFAEDSEELEESLREAQMTLEQLEQSVQVLESEPVAPTEKAVEVQSMTALAPLADRLEELARDAAKYVQDSNPGEDLLKRLGERLPEETAAFEPPAAFHEAFEASTEALDGTDFWQDAAAAESLLSGLPLLQSAAAPSAEEDEEDDFTDLLGDDPVSLRQNA